MLPRFRILFLSCVALLPLALSQCSDDSSGPGPQPVLVLLQSPSDGATGHDTSVLLSWTVRANASRTFTYDVLLDKETHLSESAWPVLTRGISSASCRVNRLQYQTDYYWKVRALSPNPMFGLVDTFTSAVFDFRTKQSPINKYTLCYSWSTDGYINGVKTVRHDLTMACTDMSWTYRRVLLSDNSTASSSGGYFSLVGADRVQFRYSSGTNTPPEFTYSFSTDRRTMYLKLYSGYDFMDATVGTNWPFTR